MLIRPSDVEGIVAVPDWLLEAQKAQLKDGEFRELSTPVAVIRWVLVDEKEIVYKPLSVKELTSKSFLVVLEKGRYIAVNWSDVFIVQDSQGKIERIKEEIEGELVKSIERETGVRATGIKHSPPFEIEIKMEGELRGRRKIKVLGTEVRVTFFKGSAFLLTGEVNKLIKGYIETKYRRAA